ncbi:MAG: CPBP family intramembrane metalloprotease [Sphingopyxis sp.]|uniref:CPBP family intramembrane glutamic endopeptidase n=1 Tax=Sphingopyxis sp. TaxID=1908224 RepID=UPI001A42E551|nr:CPBP family intramembrane glutamic endopeptidase [Sphingopyxis sp.]MBL9070103.1 CPBP family intramembrane metalloprotease [Sphingopyxis sp.]
MAALVELGSERWLKPGRYRWLRALAFLAVLAVACILAFNLAADATLRLAAMLAGEPFTTRAAAPSGARLSAVLVGSVGMLGTYALAVRLGEGRAAREIDPKRAPRELALGIAIGGAIMAIIIGVMWSAGWVVISAAPITGVAEAMKQAIQSAVIEETLMRIIIFRMLWRAFGVWPALLSTAILFGGLHLANPDASLFGAICLIAGEGIGAGLYLLTGRVWMSIGMHAGWNFALGWLFGSAVSGLDSFVSGPLRMHPAEGVTTLLSGGGFGPEASVAAFVVSLAGSLICLTLAWRKGRLQA